MNHALNKGISLLIGLLHDLNENLQQSIYDNVKSPAIDLYFSFLSKLEKGDREEGKNQFQKNKPEKEKYFLQNLINSSGNRFLTDDDKAYIKQSGEKAREKKGTFKNIEKATIDNQPELYNSVKEISDHLGEPMPSVFVYDADENKKFTGFSIPLARQLIFSRQAVAELNSDELLYLVGHEYSHLYPRHMEIRIC